MRIPARHVKYILGASALALMLAATAQAQDILVPADENAGKRYSRQPMPTLQDSLNIFESGNMEAAFKNFNRLATRDAVAAFYLAYMMDKGLGNSAPNPAAAAVWYKKSADQDYLPAVTYMGYIYDVGHGVAQDDKKALKWYTKAAQMGNADAQNALGTMLREGRGYKKDYQLAAQWFLQAATQNNARAQSNLASMYFLGRGVQENIPAAVHWYELAAKQNDTTALAALGAMYRNGVGVNKNSEMALKYYEQAAQQEHLPAQLALAEMYEAAEGDKTRDASDAAIWYGRAAKKGSLEAQTRLGYYTENGVGLPQDIPTAVSWYTAAAKKKHMPAVMALARLYENGKGAALPPDIKKAVHLYKACGQAGNPEAQMRLGELYRTGRASVIPRDLVLSYQWYALAAEGFPEGENKHTAVKNRIEMSNAMTEEQLKRARAFVARWKPSPLSRTLR